VARPLHQSDLAREVREYFVERYSVGSPVKTIRLELELAHPEALAEGEPAYWVGLAAGEWDCGVLEPDVLREAERRAADGAGVAACLQKLQSPNPKPQGRRKRFTRPIYAPGDCLAVILSGEEYGAALVLGANTKRGEGYSNLVGTLRYKAPALPGREVFERREWLVLTHHSWKGQPEIVWRVASNHPIAGGDELIRVGRIELREDDPQSAQGYTGWGLAHQIEAQDAWDRGVR